MRALYLLLALVLVLVGHTFRLLRWEQFIRIYERPMRGRMLRGMAGGYALNFVLPFHLGDVFRAVFTGTRMKSGIGFSLATVIMDRFLDVWFVALGFIGFWAAGFGGEVVHRAARYYLVFSLVLALGLVLVVLLRDWLKKICLAFCGIFNDTLKLDGMMFFWSLINTFKDLGRVKIGRLVVNTLVMWAAYLGSYGALAAALTAAGVVMPLVTQTGANPNLMVLSLGAGSLMFSHVNDSGFWMFKEYFNLSIKDTICSWSIMETIVSVVGLIGVMILNMIV